MDAKAMNLSLPADFGDLAEKAVEASRMMKLLANERRLLLLCHLANAGEMSVGALAASVGLSQSAASQHLALMREDGLIAFRRDGQTLHYKITDPNVAHFLSMLKSVFCNPPASPG
jgi:DNA-binding transcriptional ArsR family regulator